jgi:hypothetical protein
MRIVCIATSLNGFGPKLFGSVEPVQCVRGASKVSIGMRGVRRNALDAREAKREAAFYQRH